MKFTNIKMFLNFSKILYNNVIATVDFQILHSPTPRHFNQDYVEITVEWEQWAVADSDFE